MAKLTVGVDLGGTSLRAAAVDAGGKRRGAGEAKTLPEEGLEAVLGRVVQVVDEALAEAGATRAELRGVGCGVPGAVEPGTGHVHHAPNLDWEEEDVGPRLAELLGVPVDLDNDVNVAILGEQRWGAARGAASALGVWVGTGIGGGLVLGGQLVRGAHGAAGEIGHCIVLPHGPTCGCGNRGCVEALASRTAIEAEIRRHLERGEDSVVPALLKKSGKTRITSGVLNKALKKDDRVVAAAMALAQRYLGIAMSAWINVLDPEVVVVGGGLVEKMGERFLEPVVHEARRHMFKTRGTPTRFVEAELGDWSGVMGAAALVC